MDTYKYHKQWVNYKVIQRQCRVRTSSLVNSGKIIKSNSCYICRVESNKLEAHHIDYHNPYSVFYLCKECHTYIHNHVNLHFDSLYIGDKSIFFR